MTNEELLSRTVNFLRLPLIIGVVMIHSRIGTSYIAEGVYPIYTTISHIISNILARVAVPCFFIFSGYFFFRKVDHFTTDVYREKLFKRARTVLLPIPIVESAGYDVVSALGAINSRVSA